MLTIPGYLVRVLTAMLVVFGTYNPSGYSYYHWLQIDIGDWALKLFVGLVILILFYLQGRATWRSMRFPGTATLTAIIATGIWLASDLDLVDLGDVTERILVFQIGLATLLGTGFCWSHVRYRLSGQTDSENIAA